MKINKEMKLPWKQTIKKSVIWIVILILWIYIVVWLYSFIFEQDKLAIDRYNFEQLEKAKPILESIPENAKKFYTLKEFNEQYRADIKPIDNCYYISNSNWNQKYIFWFQLKSKIYRFIYFKSIFAHQKYSLPVDKMCTNDSCTNVILNHFYNIISNPCKD